MNQICSGIWYALIVTTAFITAVDYRWQALFSDMTGGNEIFPITQAVRGCGDHGKHRGIKARELHVQWEVLLEVWLQQKVPGTIWTVCLQYLSTSQTNAALLQGSLFWSKQPGNHWRATVSAVLCVPGSHLTFCSETTGSCSASTVLRGHRLNRSLLSWPWIFPDGKKCSIRSQTHQNISQALFIFMWHSSDMLCFLRLPFEKFI